MSLSLPKKWMTAGVVLAGLVAIACSNQVGSSGLNSPLNSPSETTFVADTGPGPVPIIEPDVLYQAELDGARFETSGWRTDFSRHTVAFRDIQSGGVGRDGIPPLDRPQFESISEAAPVMNDLEPVVTIKVNGEARAYPLAILTWHEVIDDVVGGERSS